VHEKIILQNSQELPKSGESKNETVCESFRANFSPRATMSTGPDPTVPAGGEFSAGPPKPTSDGPPPASGGKLSAEDLITLNEEIASMAKAGLPLDQGMAVLAREMGRGRLKNVTQQLADDLRAGHTLPEALERQKGRVPSYYAALLAAGIRSGRLGDVLGTLTIYARSVADFRANLISALLYPSIVFLMGIGLVALVGFYVLPVYAQIFQDFKMRLPMVTEILIFISRRPIGFLLLPPVLVISVTAVLWLSLRRTPRGRVIWARFVYSLPVIGSLIRSARLGAFTDLLGILIDQKVPLPEALSLAAETSSDPLLAEGAKLVERDIRQGVPFGAALETQRLVPRLVVWMVGFGERQGDLGKALRQVTDMYRRQAEVRATFLRTVLPPLLIIVVAATLGVVFIFGLYGPLLELLDGLSGGGRK
jgi:type II secretory pathway component PulF